MARTFIFGGSGALDGGGVVLAGGAEDDLDALNAADLKAAVRTIERLRAGHPEGPLVQRKKLSQVNEWRGYTRTQGVLWSARASKDLRVIFRLEGATVRIVGVVHRRTKSLYGSQPG
jgi:hypothetical protein